MTFLDNNHVYIWKNWLLHVPCSHIIDLSWGSYIKNEKL